MLDRENHEIILKKILRDLYQNSFLSPVLAFKGGTCLYLFYDLDRFSTDLDFNLIGDDFPPEIVTEILRRYLTLEDVKKDKFNTWFWLGGFLKGKQKIKIEISKRKYPDKYIIKNYYGLSVNTMSSECMFSHKLCVITDRKNFQNRDLYDAHFMFRHNFDVDEEIIKNRTDMTAKQYFKFLHDFIKKNVNSARILHGIGDLLDEKQKKWAKDHLVNESLFELGIRM